MPEMEHFNWTTRDVLFRDSLHVKKLLLSLRADIFDSRYFDSQGARNFPPFGGHEIFKNYLSRAP